MDTIYLLDGLDGKDPMKEDPDDVQRELIGFQAQWQGLGERAWEIGQKWMKSKVLTLANEGIPPMAIRTSNESHLRNQNPQSKISKGPRFESPRAKMIETNSCNNNNVTKLT